MNTHAGLNRNSRFIHVCVHFMELRLPFGRPIIYLRKKSHRYHKKESLFNGFKRNNKIIFNFALDLVDIIPSV